MVWRTRNPIRTAASFTSNHCFLAATSCCLREREDYQTGDCLLGEPSGYLCWWGALMSTCVHLYLTVHVAYAYTIYVYIHVICSHITVLLGYWVRPLSCMWIAYMHMRTYTVIWSHMAKCVHSIGCTVHGLVTWQLHMHGPGMLMCINQWVGGTCTPLCLWSMTKCMNVCLSSHNCKLAG